MKKSNSSIVNAIDTFRTKYFLYLFPLFALFACVEYNENDDPGYEILNSSISEKNGFQYASFETLDFENILRDLYPLSDGPDPGQIVLIASYYKDHFAGDKDFFQKQSTGISLIYEDAGRTFHKLYINQDGRFIESSDYSLPLSKNINKSTFRRLSYIVKEDNHSLLLIINGSVQQDRIGHVFADIINETPAEELNYLEEAVSLVTKDEFGLIDDDCSDDCVGSCVNEEAEFRGASFSLNLDKARRFRDDYLSVTPKGREYINHYKTLSLVLSKASFLKKASLLADYEASLKIYGILEKFTGDDDQSILISQDDKAFFLDYIDKELTNVSKDFEFQAILQTVKSDLHKYANKTVETVQKDFNKGS